MPRNLMHLSFEFDLYRTCTLMVAEYFFYMRSLLSLLWQFKIARHLCPRQLFDLQIGRVEFWIFVLIFSTALACRKQQQIFDIQNRYMSCWGHNLKVGGFYLLVSWVLSNRINENQCQKSVYSRSSISPINYGFVHCASALCTCH